MLTGEEELGLLGIGICIGFMVLLGGLVQRAHRTWFRVSLPGRHVGLYRHQHAVLFREMLHSLRQGKRGFRHFRRSLGSVHRSVFTVRHKGARL